MKKQSIQMAILLVIVVGLVFVIAFASQYLQNRGITRGPNSPDVPVNPLTFPLAEARFLQNGKYSPEHEWKVPDSCDFWFENITGAPVQIGLNYQSCKCTNVSVGVLPKEWKAVPAVASLMAFNTCPVLLPGRVLAQQIQRPSPGPGTEWRPLERENDKGVTVPADGAGWVRMAWKGEKLGPERLTAKVWMAAPNSGAVTPLEVTLVFVEPIRVEPRLAQVGYLGQGRGKGEVEILCWSSTRPQFKLTAEVPDDDPFVTCGRPVPLTPDECQKLPPEKHGRVQAAYHVPVVVSESLSDGRQLDLGLFERRVVLSSDSDVEPITVTIRGAVRGYVSVGVEPKKGEVILQAFNPRLGTKETVPVVAEHPDLDLEVDKVPSFMEVKLEKIPDAPGSWDLTVRILPNNNLPDGTAIYLKTKDRPPRRIRVPVSALR